MSSGLADAKQAKVVRIVEDEDPARLALDPRANRREQLLVFQGIRQAQVLRNGRVILRKRGLVVGVYPEDGAGCVVASAVCVLDGDLGFTFCSSVCGSARNDRGKTHPDPPRPQSAALW